MEEQCPQAHTGAAPDPLVLQRLEQFRGMKFGLMLHWGIYVKFVHQQIQELMTGYGPIQILWLDSDWVQTPREDIRMPELARMARQHQPGLSFNPQNPNWIILCNTATST